MASCHACQSPDFERLLPATKGKLRLNRCLGCGLVYLESWKQSLESSEELYDYYARLTAADLQQRYSSENQARQRALLETLRRGTRGGRLLDVGCGEGQILRTAAKEGWDAVGIDLSESAIRLCKELGLPASRTDFFDASLDGQRFDAIVMSELLEHVPQPARFLRRAEELLEPGGILYLTTPNFGSLSRRLLGNAWSVIHPEHIGYFERSSLKRMLSENTGLRPMRIDANNISPSTLIAWLRRPTKSQAASTGVAGTGAKPSVDQSLRRAIHQSRILTVSKEALNRLISVAGLGDSLVAWLEKPTS